MPACIVVEHPLIKHHLGSLRDAATPPAEFRRLVHRLAGLLAYEATRDLPTMPVEVSTPVSLAQAHRIESRVGLVPILRAGLAMVEPVLDFLPEAEVWHLGLYRDEATAQPVEYYRKLPADQPVDVAMVLDTMLATGGSALAALAALQSWGVPQVKVCALIASRDGVTAVLNEFPQVQLYVCAVDEVLNSHKYIVPGLGDAGDRTFNTLPRHL